MSYLTRSSGKPISTKFETAEGSASGIPSLTGRLNILCVGSPLIYWGLWTRSIMRIIMFMNESGPPSSPKGSSILLVIAVGILIGLLAPVTLAMISGDKTKFSSVSFTLALLSAYSITMSNSRIDLSCSADNCLKAGLILSVWSVDGICTFLVKSLVENLFSYWWFTMTIVSPALTPLSCKLNSQFIHKVFLPLLSDPIQQPSMM